MMVDSWRIHGLLLVHEWFLQVDGTVATEVSGYHGDVDWQVVVTLWAQLWAQMMVQMMEEPVLRFALVA